MTNYFEKVVIIIRVLFVLICIEIQYRKEMKKLELPIYRPSIQRDILPMGVMNQRMDPFLESVNISSDNLNMVAFSREELLIITQNALPRPILIMRLYDDYKFDTKDDWLKWLKDILSRTDLADNLKEPLWEIWRRHRGCETCGKNVGNVQERVSAVT